jgi:outer membrane lipopolysaccharide assembly protein LptE/RlpB
MRLSMRIRRLDLDCQLLSLCRGLVGEQHIQFAVLVLAVGAQVLANGHSLLDQEVQVFRDFRGKTCKKTGLATN